MVATATASPGCLSKHEARAKWPKAHLWWSGPDHCWSNVRGEYSHRKGRVALLASRTRAQATKGDRIDARPPVPEPAPRKPPEEIIYPPLVPNQVPTMAYTDPTVSTGWRPLIDIDDESKDYCCWPDLKTLQAETAKQKDKKR